MTGTNTVADELWAWVYPPLQQLREGIAEPEAVLEQHFAEFLEQLGLREASDHPLIWSFWERLETLSDDGERVRFLAGDEVETLVYELVSEFAGQQERDDSAEEAPETYDEAAWQAFLVENGVRWDGTESSWEQFREWFLYEAAQQGFGTPTTALVSYLDGLGVVERISVLAQYGVVVESGDGGGGADIDPAALAVAEELVQENPEFADIPEERRRELLAEVLGRMSTSNEGER